MPRTVPKKDRFFGLFEKLRQPDITGSLATLVVTGREPRVTGAFQLGYIGPCANVVGSVEERAADINIYASNSNSVYRGSTVQPASVRLMAIIRT